MDVTFALFVKVCSQGVHIVCTFMSASLYRQKPMWPIFGIDSFECYEACPAKCDNTFCLTLLITQNDEKTIYVFGGGSNESIAYELRVRRLRPLGCSR